MKKVTQNRQPAALARVAAVTQRCLNPRTKVVAHRAAVERAAKARLAPVAVPCNCCRERPVYYRFAIADASGNWLDTNNGLCRECVPVQEETEDEKFACFVALLDEVQSAPEQTFDDYEPTLPAPAEIVAEVIALEREIWLYRNTLWNLRDRLDEVSRRDYMRRCCTARARLVAIEEEYPSL